MDLTAPSIPARPSTLRARRIKARLSVASRKSRVRTSLVNIHWDADGGGQEEESFEESIDDIPVLADHQTQFLLPPGVESTPGTGTNSTLLEGKDEIPQTTELPIAGPSKRKDAKDWRLTLPRITSSDSANNRESILRRSADLTTEEAILTDVFSGQLAPTIADVLLADDDVEVVPVYDAIALYDFDASLDESDDAISFKAGDRLKVFGKRNVRNTVFTEDDGGDFQWEKEVEVSEGWCQAERLGKAGFAPVAYLQFASDTTPLETRSQIDLVITGPLDSPPLDCIMPSNPTLADSLISMPDPSVVSSFAETSISQSSYPSAAMSALGNGMGAMTDKLRKRLRSLLGSWFEGGDSVQDFILGNACGSAPRTFSDMDGSRSSMFADYMDDTEPGEEKHLIETERGLTWGGRSPRFSVTVKSPERHRKVSFEPSQKQNVVVDEFVAYRVFTWFDDEDKQLYTSLSVQRRYTDFEWLHDHLKRRYPPTIIPLPTLPPKHSLITNKFDKGLVESRGRGLERYLGAISRHPLLRSDGAVVLFLSCGGTSMGGLTKDDLARLRQEQTYKEDQIEVVLDDDEWIEGRKMFDQRRSLQGPEGGPANFLKRVAVSVPARKDGRVAAVQNPMDRFATHLSLMESHMAPMLDASARHRDNVSELHTRYASMANALEDMGRGKADEGRMMRNLAWCWKRGCFGCHEFSGSLLAVSKHLKGVADVYEAHVSFLCSRKMTMRKSSRVLMYSLV
ncbi:uncharacterized protein EV422DRAFT_110284 [Fimicolochytrium jonesii]|uniref:uncharacterized protein n=1 Tax=Fimicolochytrium jonesii TaxID=1396493 RepID=UPI0022FDF3B4|nr:uncharacterized protein EV422DRAFT_110284 [Fimicolochytrium jonesii]KAI8819377.1 hypothetical protein EV422DRAFT_110284 [Fimicolochytrium jonesii]